MPTAKPPAHQRLVLSGVLTQAAGGGSEIFEFGMAIVSSLSAKAAAQAAQPVALAFWGGDANQGIPQTAQLTGVRVEDVEADGKVSDSYFAAITPARQGAGQNTIPTILSHAITLETDSPGGHGRMVRGRFYPPASCQVVGSTATLDEVNTYAGQWIGLLNGLKGAGLQPAVASTTDGGQVVDVTGITVDTVIDTVRRRKNHVTAARSGRVAITS